MIKMDKRECCMCYACVQICPKHCINVILDNEGFYYPIINEKRCIQCRLCERVCPILNKKYNSNNELLSDTYVAFAKDDNFRLKSSSGGLFPILAQHILKDNGIVFGAAFDDEFLVHHIGIDKANNLQQICGSKYLQSRIENTYIETKKYLDAGKKVLFSGTACQISGLKAFLRKDYKNLFTIDVLCHGVPSPKVWRRYLDEKEKEYNSVVEKISFRSKKTGWKSYSMLIEFVNGKIYEKIATQDEFMKLFLENICLRPSCHKCYFKKNRFSDITLGDCWGIENYMPDLDDNKGTSVVLVHTERGNKLFFDVKEKIEIAEAELNKILPPTADSRKSVLQHPKRMKFFKLFNQNYSINRLQFLIKTPFIKRKIGQCKLVIFKIYMLIKAYKNKDINKK